MTKPKVYTSDSMNRSKVFTSYFQMRALAVGYISPDKKKEIKWAEFLRDEKFPTSILPWEWHHTKSHRHKGKKEMSRNIRWVGFTVNGNSYLLDLKEMMVEVKTDEGWESADEIEFSVGAETEKVFDADANLIFNATTG